MNKQQRKNLAKLKDFLLDNDLPFNMRCWRTSENGLCEPVTQQALSMGVKGCGTAGCAAGWAPFIIPPLKEEFVFHREEYEYLLTSIYLARVFGITTSSPKFHSIFSNMWTDVDNTREGAAYRIHMLLKDNTLFHPSNWTKKDQELRDKWVARPQTKKQKLGSLLFNLGDLYSRTPFYSINIYCWLMTTSFYLAPDLNWKRHDENTSE